MPSHQKVYTIHGLIIMLSRPGPTPIHLIGTFVNCSINSTYFLQFSGRESYVVTLSIEVCQPDRVTYSTWTLERRSRSAGNKVWLVGREKLGDNIHWPGNPGSSFPSTVYLMATLISGSLSRISSLVRLRLSYPLIMQEYLRTTRSSHPQRLRRPVVVPYSRPTSWKWTPVFWRKGSDQTWLKKFLEN